MTGAAVGSGVESPLGGPARADEVDRLAVAFRGRVAHDADDIALGQFVRARGLDKQTAAAVRNRLATHYKMPGFGQRRFAEGISGGAWAGDIDGGKGMPAGGSPFDDTNRAASVSPSDRTCPRCGEDLRPDQRVCQNCESIRLNGYAERSGAGALGTHGHAQVGHVRIPGGPVDSSEKCIVVDVLSPTLVEVEVAGTKQTHSWSTASTGIAFGLSRFGRATSSAWVRMVHEWLWTEALPGDKLVVTLDGRDAYVMDKAGYRRNLRR